MTPKDKENVRYSNQLMDQIYAGCYPFSEESEKRFIWYEFQIKVDGTWISKFEDRPSSEMCGVSDKIKDAFRADGCEVIDLSSGETYALILCKGEAGLLLDLFQLTDDERLFRVTREEAEMCDVIKFMKIIDDSDLGSVYWCKMVIPPNHDPSNVKGNHEN